MYNNITLNNFRNSTLLKYVSCIFLALVADVFFFGHRPGWTSGVFTLLLCGIYILHTNNIYINGRAKILLVLIAGQAIALFESSNWISYLLIITGFLLLIFLQKTQIYHSVRQFISFALKVCLRFFVTPIIDVLTTLKFHNRNSSGYIYNALSNWVVPILFSIVFVLLFALANPIIESWVKKIDLYLVFKYLSISRIMFWLLMLSICWIVIRPRRLIRFVKLSPANKSRYSNVNAFSNSLIIRALVMFNIIFAFQTAMDISYLWGGAKLPDGMTYAKYALKGAYPLMVTAILAAIFVLISMKPNSESARSEAIRKLVYAWICQNILLVISSIWRLVIYIQAYQLTGLRVAALIWMGLVAFGLSMIIVRIINKKDNFWLINTNFVALFSVLYICSFLNFGGIVAEYNVNNSYEYKGTGKQLDYYYLQRNIGVEALPALVKLKGVMESKRTSTKRLNETIQYINKKCYRCFEVLPSPDARIKPAKNWRQWTYRQYRIEKYLTKEGF